MNRALQYALNLLAKKDYSEFEIRQKFKQHQIAKEEAETALIFLKEKAFIDDAKLASNYLNIHQSRGSIRIKFELLKKGINEEIIRDILNGLDPCQEKEKAKEVALQWLNQKKNKYIDKYKQKQSLIAKLGRQGFSYDIASDVANQLLN